MCTSDKNGVTMTAKCFVTAVLYGVTVIWLCCRAVSCSCAAVLRVSLRPWDAVTTLTISLLLCSLSNQWNSFIVDGTLEVVVCCLVTKRIIRIYLNNVNNLIHLSSAIGWFRFYWRYFDSARVCVVQDCDIFGESAEGRENCGCGRAKARMFRGRGVLHVWSVMCCTASVLFQMIIC